MLKNAIFRRLYADAIVRAAYRGLLGREGEPTGIAAYAKTIRAPNDLVEVLTSLGFSDEHWEKSLGNRAPDLVQALYRELLGREPEPGACEGHSARLAQTHDLPGLLAEIARSDEYWKRAIEAHSRDLVRSVYSGLFGREPEPEALASHAAKLAETQDLATLLAEFARSDEHWNKVFRSRSSDMVGTIYRGILSREPEPEALERDSTKVAESGDLTPLLAELVSSDEHWQQTLDACASDLVRSVYKGILGREPDPDALDRDAATLADTRNLGRLLAELVGSEERWRLSFAARSGDIVRAVYQHLLGREPEPEVLENSAATVADEGALSSLIQDISKSAEFRRKGISNIAETLVQSAYRGLLGRDADPGGLKIYTSQLIETSDFSKVLEALIAGDEFSRRHALLIPTRDTD